VKWTIVTEQSYERWAAETDDDHDVELRIQVLTWVLALRDAGPPSRGVHDPFRDTLHCEVGETGVWVEYLVLPYLTEPAIVIRSYRGP
jgi:hypothetical protein